jgi:EAL and modified HD-GYP domain-containing signal transduction protein
MTQSVLGSVTLGYELIWNQKRRCCAVRLFVEADSHSAPDARHLIAAITELWPESAPTLLLNVRSPSLLNGLLDHTPVRGVWMEIQDHWLSDELFAGRVRKAHQRGLPMVWSGEPGQVPAADVETWFHKTLRVLTPFQALAALRVSLRQQQDAGVGAPQTGPSPVLAGCLYEGLASQALVEHALDRQGVWGVCGWPAEEILHAYRFRQIQPSRLLIRALVKAIEADESLEALEHRMGDEPLLTYRFLRYANSVHLGSRSEVGSVRQGLMVMGYTKLRSWLMAQIAHASGDLNLEPILFNLVLRARIMEQLADAGVEGDLRREVFLCGIFSQLDLLLGEPLGAAIHRLPLPGRIASAVVGQTGPYAPWLEVATALESGNTPMIHDVCKAHAMPAAEVNRALLRTLAAI